MKNIRFADADKLFTNLIYAEHESIKSDTFSLQWNNTNNIIKFIDKNGGYYEVYTSKESKIPLIYIKGKNYGNIDTEGVEFIKAKSFPRKYMDFRFLVPKGVQGWYNEYKIVNIYDFNMLGLNNRRKYEYMTSKGRKRDRPKQMIEDFINQAKEKYTKEELEMVLDTNNNIESYIYNLKEGDVIVIGGEKCRFKELGEFHNNPMYNQYRRIIFTNQYDEERVTWFECLDGYYA